MAGKLDLDKIKDEIDSRKKEKNMVSSRLGEGVGRGVAPRDEFLHGLMKSLTEGVPTPSLNLIKNVENSVAVKNGETAKHRISEAPTQVEQPRKKIDMSPERDEQLFADLEQKRKQTLAESIAGFTGGKTGNPTTPTVDYNGQQMLTSIPQNEAPTTGAQINEQVLIESVKEIVNGHLSENLGPIFEEAIKDTIIEMYAMERIKDVLNENRNLIKDVVVETIKEIQARTKAKQQSK